MPADGYMNAPRVGVVVVTWNKREQVLALLEQLRSLAYANYTVIVVDNASSDGTPEAIRAHHPEIRLIVNNENVGGSIGFSTGLRDLLQNGDCKYAWLLDNDAAITPLALSQLVAVCEADASIGVAGSLIKDIDNRAFIVEAGARLHRGHIVAEPHLRNVAAVPESTAVDCDYVAACSLLARIEAIREVGLMDERMFLNWDDMDWGLRFREAGWRVVAAYGSVVYHASFTDRDRGLTTAFYYSLRNALLTYAKHPQRLAWARACYRFLRQQGRRCCFRLFVCELSSVRLCLAALQDFVLNRWGKCRVDVPPLKRDRPIAGATLPEKRVLLVGGTSEQAIMAAHSLLSRVNPPWLLIPDDRHERYLQAFGTRIITADSRRIGDSLFYRLLLLLRLSRKKFDAAVCFEPTMFTFACSRTYLFDVEEAHFRQVPNDRRRLPLLALAGLLGELLALAALPVMLVTGWGYRPSGRRSRGIVRESSVTAADSDPAQLLDDA